LIAALPADHELVDAEHLTIEDFDDRPVVMYSPVDARYFHELLISTFTIVGATPRYVQYVTQVHTMLVLVRSGLGMALVPESAATMHPEGVVFKEVTSVRDRPVQMNAAWRPDNQNPALARLMEDVLPQREWI
jgi:DNA-binding transcriptional LysR family regulator